MQGRTTIVGMMQLHRLCKIDWGGAREFVVQGFVSTRLTGRRHWRRPYSKGNFKPLTRSWGTGGGHRSLPWLSWDNGY